VRLRAIPWLPEWLTLLASPARRRGQCHILSPGPWVSLGPALKSTPPPSWEVWHPEQALPTPMSCST